MNPGCQIHFEVHASCCRSPTQTSAAAGNVKQAECGSVQHESGCEEQALLDAGLQVDHMTALMDKSTLNIYVSTGSETKMRQHRNIHII